MFRVVLLAGCAALISGLLWLDGNRAGPANSMGRCNLLLSQAGEPAADVLIVGSSRIGVALDPVAMEHILSAELGRRVRVDRLSLGRNPLRTMSGLLENYLEARGSPAVVALEIMLMTERSVNRLAQRGLALAPEDYNYLRDVNLLRFEQLLSQPSVAMPFTRSESVLSLWSQRLRGVALRSGALIYQALRDPNQEWELSACARDDWRREAEWPSDFSFSYGEFEPDTGLADLVQALEIDVARQAEARALKDWQFNSPGGIAYPYDLGADYRRGEVNVLVSMIERILDRDAEIVVLPLPLYGYVLDRAELLDFVMARFERHVHLFDLYGEISANFGPLWYDDAHVERSPVGALTTALMAQRLLKSRALVPAPSELDD